MNIPHYRKIHKTRQVNFNEIFKHSITNFHVPHHPSFCINSRLPLLPSLDYFEATPKCRIILFLNTGSSECITK